MKHHNCNENTMVLDTRRTAGCWYRRRECLVCHRRFNTVEVIVPDGARPAQWGANIARRGLDRKRLADCLQSAEAFAASLRKAITGGEA